MTGRGCEGGAVHAILLAAGASRRLGRSKQLTVGPTGEPLVVAAARAALGSSADTVTVVLGHDPEGVTGALGPLPVNTTWNPRWSEGMGSSLAWAVGLQTSLPGPSAFLVLLCDQPAVNAAHLRTLVTLWREGANLVASTYGGVVGVPAVFDATYREALLGCTGDEGARGLLRRANPGTLWTVPLPGGEVDVDEPAARSS